MNLNGHMLSMARITTDDFSSVYEGLLRTERMYDPRAIRELKGNVFRLAGGVPFYKYIGHLLATNAACAGAAPDVP